MNLNDSGPITRAYVLVDDQTLSSGKNQSGNTQYAHDVRVACLKKTQLQLPFSRQRVLMVGTRSLRKTVSFSE